MEILACPRIPVLRGCTRAVQAKTLSQFLCNISELWISPLRNQILLLYLRVVHEKKFHIAWYWSLRFEMKHISEYSQRSTTTLCVTSCTLNFALYRAMYHQVLSQHETSSESNYNRNIWGQSPGLINWFQSCSSSARILPLNCRILFE